MLSKIQSDYIIWPSEEKLTTDQILEVVKNYWQGKEYKLCSMYDSYYESRNKDIVDRYKDRMYRGKTPNNLVPTAYYATIIDSMAGYMFNNVNYESTDEQYMELLNTLLEDNNVDVKDMQTGVRSLAYNKGIELVYTVGDGEKPAEIKFVSIDPKEAIVIWNNNIEPDVFCFIRVTGATNKEYDYNIDVIYSNEWQYYYMKDNSLSMREEPRTLYFQENPCIVYNSELLNIYSPFHRIISYIDALDFLITGNSNEIERIVDALLVLGKSLKPEDMEHMDEWKVLMDMHTEDRAEYITKDMTPSFREYVSKLLINEIHKHSHVIDWYSPDQGLTGTASAKALQTRLFDMNMFSNRIEKIYKEGAYKRLRLIQFLLNAKGISTSEPVKIIFNRTLPSDVEDKAQILSGVDFLSKQTKIELCGLSYSEESQRLENEKPETIPITPEIPADEDNELG